MATDFRLSISEKAKKQIAVLTDGCKAKYNLDEAIPAIVWLDSELNKGVVLESEPAIGFYNDRADIAPADLLILDGIEIALGVADEDIFRFQDKTLDYENDCFVLR